jgi:hypothetical protein
MYISSVLTCFFSLVHMWGPHSHLGRTSTSLLIVDACSVWGWGGTEHTPVPVDVLYPLAAKKIGMVLS